MMKIIRLKDDFFIPNDTRLHKGMEWLVSKYDTQMRKIMMCEKRDERMESFIQFIKGMIPDLYMIVKIFNKCSKKKEGIFFFHKSFPYDIDEYNDRIRLFYNFNQLVFWAGYAKMLIENGGIQEEIHHHLQSSGNSLSVVVKGIKALYILYPFSNGNVDDKIVWGKGEGETMVDVYNHCTAMGNRVCISKIAEIAEIATSGDGVDIQVKEAMFEKESLFFLENMKLHVNHEKITPQALQRQINYFFDLIAPDDVPLAEPFVDNYAIPAFKYLTGYDVPKSQIYKQIKKLDGSNKWKHNSVVPIAATSGFEFLKIFVLRRRLRLIDKFTRKKNIAKMQLKDEYIQFSEYQIYILADCIVERFPELNDVQKWFKDLQVSEHVTDHTIKCACCCIPAINLNELEPLKCNRCNTEYDPGIYSNKNHDECRGYVCNLCLPLKKQFEMGLIFWMILAVFFPNSSPTDIMPDVKQIKDFLKNSPIGEQDLLKLFGNQ